MTSLAKLLIRFYPANWRARYGDEFEALLEDSSPSLPGVFDVLKGAVKMRLSVPSFPKLALVLSLAGLLIGLGISYVVTPTYISAAVMRYVPGPLTGSTPADSRNLSERLMQSENEILSRTSLASIIADPRLDLYKEERSSQPLEDVIEKMRTRAIRIRVVGSAQNYLAFEITFAYRDRIKAMRTVQALITKFIETNLTSQRNQAQVKQAAASDHIYRLEERIAALEKRLGIPPAPHEAVEQGAFFTGINLDVLDPPSLPVNAAKPNRSIFMAGGVGTGFISAVLMAIFRRGPPLVPFPAQTL
jgi:hypothetical protein